MQTRPFKAYSVVTTKYLFLLISQTVYPLYSCNIWYMCNTILLVCVHFCAVILMSLGRDIVINNFPWYRCISATSLQLISTQLSYLYKTLGPLRYNWLIDLRTCLMATSSEDFTLLSVLANFLLRRWKYARCLHMIRRERACRACRFLEYITGCVLLLNVPIFRSLIVINGMTIFLPMYGDNNLLLNEGSSLKINRNFTAANQSHHHQALLFIILCSDWPGSCDVASCYCSITEVCLRFEINTLLIKSTVRWVCCGNLLVYGRTWLMTSLRWKIPWEQS